MYLDSSHTYLGGFRVLLPNRSPELYTSGQILWLSSKKMTIKLQQFFPNSANAFRIWWFESTHQMTSTNINHTLIVPHTVKIYKNCPGPHPVKTSKFLLFDVHELNDLQDTCLLKYAMCYTGFQTHQTLTLPCHTCSQSKLFGPPLLLEHPNNKVLASKLKPLFNPHYFLHQSSTIKTETDSVCPSIAVQLPLQSVFPSKPLN